MRQRARSDDYAAKGRLVCERWAVYANFFADMGERPPGLTLERKNNDEGYEPSNCVWATYKQQAHNTSGNRWIEAAGQRQLLADWAREVGVSAPGILARIKRGWTEEAAVTTTARPNRGRKTYC